MRPASRGPRTAAPAAPQRSAVRAECGFVHEQLASAAAGDFRYARSAGTPSGGEQQMTVLGRALTARPRILLLDEPSLGIAPKLVQKIARSIVAICRDEGVSVLLVEQNSRMALAISQGAHALSTGSLVLGGPSRELVADERITAAHLGGEP